MDPRYARSSDPETSQAAAVRLRPHHMWVMILDEMKVCPHGFTAEELGDLLPAYDGVWKRVSDLNRDRLIAPVLNSKGIPVTRPGRSNRQQRAFNITFKGREWLGSHG